MGMLERGEEAGKTNVAQVMKFGETYYIQLCNSRYQVKVENGNRMVFYNGEWITHERFIDRLIPDNKAAELFELFKLGLKTAQP